MEFPEKLKVALVHTADSGGGAELCVVDLHQSLQNAGHESRIFVGRKESNDSKVVEIPRDRPIPGVLRLTRWLENSRGLQNLYAPWFRNLHKLIGDVDVVHLHSVWGGEFGYADLTGVQNLARRYPLVMTLHDSWLMTGHCACPIGCERWKTGCGNCPDLNTTPAIPIDSTATNWKRKQSTFANSRVHLTTVSSWLKSQVEQSPILRDKPVSVVHNSLDCERFTPGDRSASRRELHLPQDVPCLLWIAKGHPGLTRSSLNYLNEALKKIDGVPPHVCLLGLKDTEQIPGDFGADFTVVDPLPPEKMAIGYQAADVTVVLSEYESFGRVAAESMLCETPVIAFAVGGLTDIIQDKETGWLVDVGDADQLAKSMIEASSMSDSDREKLGTAGREHCLLNYAPDKITRDYLAVYQQIMENARKPV